MRRRRIRTRLRSGAAALATLAALAGCAGSRDEARETQGPTFEAGVAEALAASADRVADLLAAGDTCGAAHAADDLQLAVIQAVNAGDVPAAFQEELGAVAAELVDGVNCPPVTEPADDGDGGTDTEDEDNGKGKGKGKDKGKRKGRGDDG